MEWEAVLLNLNVDSVGPEPKHSLEPLSGGHHFVPIRHVMLHSGRRENQGYG